MNELIKNNALLVWYWVRRYEWLLETRGDIDRDDLFQAGCIGLFEASATWDAARGAFSTWASWYIRKEIRECLGRKKRLQAFSLDAPAYRDEDNDAALLDTLPDTSIIPDDERILSREIVDTVRAAVDALPEDCAAVVRSVELEGRSHAKTAAAMGITPDAVRRFLAKGIRDLRKDKHIRALALDQETRFHARKSVAAFNTSGSSVVEDAVIWREEHMFDQKPPEALRQASDPGAGIRQ